MFSKPIVVHRPELRSRVLALIGMVTKEPEGVAIGVGELITLLGVQVSGEFGAMLTNRGEIVLHHDRFDNVGPGLEREVRIAGFGVNLEVPARLQGGLLRRPDGFRLDFDPGHSVALHKFLFHVELRHVDLSPSSITIDFQGASTIVIDVSPA